jgi:DNA-binding SARP family transcriptional activator
MPVRIALAGRAVIESDGEPVPSEAVRMAGWVVLAYLISQRHRPVRPDELADIIWGEHLPRSWATMVRGLVSKLRTALKAAGLDSDVISTAFGCYQLKLPSTATVDVEEAATDVALAEAALAAGRLTEARERAARACSVASAEFLPGASGTWVETRQRELVCTRVRALEALSQAAASSGAAADAIAAAEEAMKLEPLRESSHLRLILAHVAAGNRAEALRAYERCRRILAEELGVKPSTAIEAEYLRLLAEDEDVAPAPSPRRPDAGALPAALALAGHAPLIGRSQELEQLWCQWQQATRGGRYAVFIAGEPGIGKTRLVAQLAWDIHAAGGRVLYGRCDEEVEVPYQPFAEAVRRALDQASATDLALHVKAWGGELARLVPELVSRLPEVPTALGGEPQSERWRMFEAVDAFLSDQSTGTPLLLVLDDLHWGASPTLALLRHVLRSTRAASLLVAGTYRHTEVDAKHGLASLLADLRRDSATARLALEGLAPDDVTLLVGRSSGGPLDNQSLALAKSLHEITRGNPFFIGEVLRHLGPHWPPSLERLETAVPDGVREVVTRRLLRLGAASNRVLAAAAVCGADFDAALLEELEGPDVVLDSLEEALEARLVTDGGAPGRYSFCHALVRHTIYDQLGPVRRARLHLRVGEAVERRNGTRGPHVGALARHFAAAAPAGVAGKAADYALAAATAALDQLAFEEAVVLLRTGLAVVETGPPDVKRQGELLVALGKIYIRYDDFGAIRDIGEQLLELAKRSDSSEHVAWGLWFRTIGPLENMPSDLTAVLEESLESLDEQQPFLRASLLMQLARMRERAGESGEPAAREAVAIARASADTPELLRSILYHFVGFLRLRGDPSDIPEWLSLADEIVAIEQDIPFAVGNGVRARALARLRVGDREGYEADVAEMARRKEKSPSGQARALVIRHLVTLAGLDGRLDDIEGLSRELQKISGSMIVDPGLELAHMLFFVRRERGQAEEYLPELQARMEAGPPFLLNHAVLGLARAEAGDDEGSRRDWSTIAASIDELPASWDRPGAMALAAELLSVAGDPAQASALYVSLRPHAGLFVSAPAPAFYPVAADRALALLAATAGDFDVAEDHFQSAIALEERLRAFALAARTRYCYGRMLLASADPQRRRRAELVLGDALDTANDIRLDGLARDIRKATSDMMPHTV